MDIITNGETSYIFFEDDHYDDREDCEDDWNDTYTIDDKYRERYAFELNPLIVAQCDRAFIELRHFAIRNGLKSGPKSRDFLESFFKQKAQALYAAYYLDAQPPLSGEPNTSASKLMAVLKIDLLDWARAERLINSKLKS